MGKSEFSISLNADDLQAIMQHAFPSPPDVTEENEYSPCTLHIGPGHSGYGLYVSLSEYPEEGAMFLRSEREREAQPVGVPDVVREVLFELAKATRKFPTWPTDPLHALGVVNEETGELAKAVLQQMYEPHKNKPGDVRTEAVQACAMLIRFLQSLDAYDWNQGKQHAQGELAAAPTTYEASKSEISDAERYRYLRDVAHPDSDSGIAVGQDYMNSWGNWGTKHITGDELDKLCDAAILAAPDAPAGDADDGRDAR